MDNTKTRESRLRRRAAKQGLILRKSRRRDPSAYDYGLYALCDVEHGGTIHAGNVNSIYALTLDQVEGWYLNSP